MTLKERELPAITPVVAERNPAPAVSALVAERPEQPPPEPRQSPPMKINVPPNPLPPRPNPVSPPVVKDREHAGFELPASKLFAEMPRPPAVTAEVPIRQPAGNAAVVAEHSRPPAVTAEVPTEVPTVQPRPTAAPPQTPGVSPVVRERAGVSPVTAVRGENRGGRQSPELSSRPESSAVTASDPVVTERGRPPGVEVVGTPTQRFGAAMLPPPQPGGRPRSVTDVDREIPPEPSRFRPFYFGESR